ncbi:hypothetical protein AB6D16_003865 [Vibrio cyclitrophicus]
MSDAAQETIFQNDILEQMQSQGWLLGESNKYNKEFAINSNLEDSKNA